MPASFRRFSSNGAAFGGTEGLRSRFSAHLAALTPNGDKIRTTGVNRGFKRRAVHLFADGFFDYFTGSLQKVAFFAGAFRHDAMMTWTGGIARVP
jgi:hypothetical protein